MSWLNSEELLITQKTGEIYKVNTKNLSQSEITHEIPSTFFGQGGLLDIVTENNVVWITCSIKKGRKYTTAVYRAELKNNKLVNEELIYEALPYFDNGKHFGSRIEILDDYLFVSIGERGKGMIAQDPSNPIGSIIRIHKNGEYPEDNPFLTKNEWLPELFQIGVRNPQGMTLDPQTNSIYISNHGPKGGDFIGKVVGGSNFGWKKIGWGGTNYSGTKIGDGNAWEPGFIKPDFIWVPSIAVSGIKFYQGEAFPEWQNSLLVSSLKFQYLSVLHRKDNKFVKEEVIFKDKIGRVRDIEIDQSGNIYIIADETDSNLYLLKP
ncbi:MAG: glucose dehydrogenase [Flavobacteriaceae bacterium]|nr:glucose dehydrogenase [Flavobacteriaceae bacterium]|tara:strand:- start:98 stop:1060 length:963 start_codon:yes stop_codon:yes gene_type:complete